MHWDFIHVWGSPVRNIEAAPAMIASSHLDAPWRIPQGESKHELAALTGIGMRDDVDAQFVDSQRNVIADIVERNGWRGVRHQLSRLGCEH
jgi:hypothetical protein